MVVSSWLALVSIHSSREPPCLLGLVSNLQDYQKRLSPEILSIKNCIERLYANSIIGYSDLRELSDRASKRRMKIYKECLAISHEELSDPALEMQLSFPFVSNTLPKRFKFESKCGEHNWLYQGHEKFAELLHKLQEVRESVQNSGFWLYGTRG